MFSLDATIEAAIIGAVALIIGSMLGGFVATFFLHRMTKKAEERKVIRQKIEEIYILSNQMEEFSTSRGLDRIALSNIDFHKKYVVSSNYLLVEDSIVEKMKMIASLYIPEIVKNVDEYKQEINRANRRIERELSPNGRSITE